MTVGKQHVEAIEAMQKLQNCDDEEKAHIEADKILCDFLVTLGYAVLIDEFNKIKKWYA